MNIAFIKNHACRRLYGGRILNSQNNMATIKGQNLRVLIGEDDTTLECIAASTSCTVHLSAIVEESSHKDIEDDWLRQEVTALAWDAQVDALVLDTDDDEAMNIEELRVGKEYTLRFSRTAGAAGNKNRDEVTDTMQLTGQALLTDLQIVSENQTEATYSARFTGTGDLVQYTPPEE